jgi:hypothetical protein
MGLPGQRTATALSLSYYALKDRLEERKAGDTKPTGASATFVELPMPAAPEPNACTIELRDSVGTQPTLRFENANAVDVAAVASVNQGILLGFAAASDPTSTRGSHHRAYRSRTTAVRSG